MDVGKDLPEMQRRSTNETFHLPLDLALNDRKNVLIVALTLEVLEYLHDPLFELLDQPRLLLLRRTVMRILGND